MRYIVTIRDGWGDKLASKVEVSGENATIGDVLEQAKYELRRENFLAKWYSAGREKKDIVYLWRPDLIPPPPPKPEPVAFETLINLCMV